MTAADTLAAALPAIALTDQAGLSAYADPPKLTNRFERGQFQASRTEHIAYVAKQPGHYQLPEQTIMWWDTRSQSLQTELIPSIEIRVIPTLPQRLLQWAPGGLGLAAIAAALAYFRKALQAQWQRYLHQRQTSETAQWRRLRRACQNHDPHAAWEGLNAWLASLPPSADISRLEDLLDQAPDGAIAQASQALAAILFAPQTASEPMSSWTGDALLQALQAYRRQQSRQRSSSVHATSHLPPLNPTRGSALQ